MDVQETLLQRVIDGVATEEERASFEALAAEDPSLTAFMEGSQAVGDLLREGLRAQAESVDFGPMWAGVQKDIAWHDAGRQRALAAKAEALGLDTEPEPGWRLALARIFSWPAVATLGAAFLVLLALPQVLENQGVEAPPVARRVDPGPTELTIAALPVFAGVEVESVDASNAATVMVFQGGEGDATFIWVNENSSEETAI